MEAGRGAAQQGPGERAGRGAAARQSRRREECNARGISGTRSGYWLWPWAWPWAASWGGQRRGPDSGRAAASVASRRAYAQQCPNESDRHKHPMHERRLPIRKALGVSCALHAGCRRPGILHTAVVGHEGAVRRRRRSRTSFRRAPPHHARTPRGPTPPDTGVGLGLVGGCSRQRPSQPRRAPCTAFFIFIFLSVPWLSHCQLHQSYSQCLSISFCG